MAHVWKRRIDSRIYYKRGNNIPDLLWSVRVPKEGMAFPFVQEADIQAYANNAFYITG